MDEETYANLKVLIGDLSKDPNYAFRKEIKSIVDWIDEVAKDYEEV